MEPKLQPQTPNDANNKWCSNRKEIADELIILRAIYLSGKRAEEAERKLLLANKEKEKLAELIIEGSARISAYKNWERIIEMDSALLERRLQRRSRHEKRVDVAVLYFELGLVLLGFVGAGFVLGRNLL